MIEATVTAALLAVVLLPMLLSHKLPGSRFNWER